MEPQVTGVVIISLPPPGDPSKGKTITAFALPDDPGDFHLHPEWQQRSIDVMAPPPAAAAAPVSPLSSRLVSPRRAAVCVLGASMVVFALWACLYSEAPFEFLRSSEEGDRRREDESLLLPLFPKPGGPRFLNQEEVKLGSAAGRRKVRTAASSAAANSSAAFPVRGNIFPDGYASLLFLLPHLARWLLHPSALRPKSRKRRTPHWGSNPNPPIIRNLNLFSNHARNSELVNASNPALSQIMQ